MTKQQEIDYLDRIIKAYGPYSYIGPWLAEYRSQIIQAIKDDVPVAVYVGSQQLLRFPMGDRA